MRDVPQAFAHGFALLRLPAIRAVLWRSLTLTLLAFVLLGAAGWWGVSALLAQHSFGGTLGALAGIALALAGGWLGFRLVALFVLQFFADRVVAVVEERDYPAAALSRRDVPLAEETGMALRGVGRALLANAAALPVAALLLVTGVGAAAVFLLVNAWLLGRELQDMVWVRHRPPEVRPARGDQVLGGGTRLALGGTTALLLTVPFLGLVAPLVGAGAAAHLVHRRLERDRCPAFSSLS